MLVEWLRGFKSEFSEKETLRTILSFGIMIGVAGDEPDHTRR